MEAALEAGNAVIVIATEPHRTSLIQRLRAHGADVVTAIEQRRYIPLDAAETLATFMVNDVPDPYQFQKAVGDLFAAAAKGANGERRCVAACGEGAPTLWAEGKGDAAVQIEHLWDKLSRAYDVDTLLWVCIERLSARTRELYLRENLCRTFRCIRSERAIAQPQTVTEVLSR